MSRPASAKPLPAWALGLVLIFWANLGAGQALEGASAAEGSAPPGWYLPPPKVQLEMDPDLVPVNRGAVFVPAMSESSAEPPYLVLQKDREIARTPCGKKTLLPPGSYTVRLGGMFCSEPADLRAGTTDVAVRALPR